MSAEKLGKAALGIAATAALANAAYAVNETEIDKLIAKIEKGNDDERGEAWQGAWFYGAPAIKRLVPLMTHDDFNVARAATRGLWTIVRHVGRPGADGEREAAIAELLPLLDGDQPAAVLREVMWMVSEIAGDEAVDPVAALLGNDELREDARMVLQRLPGSRSLAALKAGLEAAPDDFKINIAQSLRARGVTVPGLPCQKMVPTRQTTVKPLQ